MQSQTDGSTEINWSIVNMLTLHNHTSLVPGVHMTAGNRKLVANLWTVLHSVWSNTGDKERMQTIGLNFMKLHPKKADEIKYTCQHFAHVMGMNYPVWGDEYNKIEGVD